MPRDRPLAEAASAELANEPRSVGHVDRIHTARPPQRQQLIAHGVAVDLLRRRPQTDDLLGEPALRRLAELQSWIDRLTLARSRLCLRVGSSPTRRRDRLERAAPP